MPDNNIIESDAKTRRRIAIGLVIGGSVIVGILGIVIMAAAAINGEFTEFYQAAQLVLTSILPLVGTWIGTVLAFYFAKENFESASRATKEILGYEDKLRSIPLKNVMIPLDKMAIFKLGEEVAISKAEKGKYIVPGNEDDISIVRMLDFLSEKNHNRLPILSNDGKAKYVIHVSTLDRFLSRQMRMQAPAAQAPAVQAPAAQGTAAQGTAAQGTAAQGTAAQGTAAQGTAAPKLPLKLDEWTIKHMRQNDPKLFQAINAWATVSEKGTLADAKVAMETTPNCIDVFVTENGHADSVVTGWLTNIEIGQRSKA